MSSSKDPPIHVHPPPGAVAVLTKDEVQRRNQRKFSYHLLGYKNQLPKTLDEEYEDQLFRHLTTSTIFCAGDKRLVKETKIALLRELAASGGDVTTDTFLSILDKLSGLYEPSVFDARRKPRWSKESQREKSPELEGMWISLSKPIFEGGLGRNSRGEYMYRLGRMSFGMFQPADLVCSIQGTFNPVHLLHSKDIKKAMNDTPGNWWQELNGKKSPLRTYKVVTAFTIEPYDSSDEATKSNSNVTRPVEGLLTTEGYIAPNPTQTNRLSVYFVSGAIEVEDISLIREWRNIFATDQPDAFERPSPGPKDRANKPRKRNILRGLFGLNKKQQEGEEEESAKVSEEKSAPIVMEEDGKMSYRLPTRDDTEPPYLDILYFDETLRISRSNSGAVYVMARVPYFKYDM